MAQAKKERAAAVRAEKQRLLAEHERLVAEKLRQCATDAEIELFDTTSKLEHAKAELTGAKHAVKEAGGYHTLASDHPIRCHFDLASKTYGDLAAKRATAQLQVRLKQRHGIEKPTALPIIHAGSSSNTVDGALLSRLGIPSLLLAVLVGVAVVALGLQYNKPVMRAKDAGEGEGVKVLRDIKYDMHDCRINTTVEEQEARRQTPPAITSALTPAPPAFLGDECPTGWAGYRCDRCGPGYTGPSCDIKVAIPPVPGANTVVNDPWPASGAGQGRPRARRSTGSDPEKVSLVLDKANDRAASENLTATVVDSSVFPSDAGGIIVLAAAEMLNINNVGWVSV